MLCGGEYWRSFFGSWLDVGRVRLVLVFGLGVLDFIVSFVNDLLIDGFFFIYL